jgi:hypothetical protein
MNEIKNQLLTEIKNRSESFSSKDVDLKSSSFPIAINSKWKKEKGRSKDVEERVKSVATKGIHRGRIGKAVLPTSYRFKPTEFKKSKRGLSYSGNTEAGVHQYSIKNGDETISVSISHKTSKRPEMKKGSLTTSKVDINLANNLGSHDVLNSVIPSIQHHIRSVRPDTIQIQTNDSTAFHKKVVSGISKKYRVSSTEKEDGTHLWTLQSRKITPRIMSLINSLLKK